MKVLVKSAWGSDDPTKAAFPFLHGNALAEAGHEVQIFLPGEAVSLMRTPVGWPPLAETLQQTIALGTRSTFEGHVHGPVGSLIRIWKTRMPHSPTHRFLYN